MTGSTLYRRLSDGTWVSEREDPDVRVAAAAAAAAVPLMVANPPAQPRPTSSLPAPDARAAGAPPAGPPAGARPPAKPRRRWWRIAGKVLVIGAVAYAAWLVFLLVYVTTSLNKVDALPADPIADTPGTVWLMVGSDSREGLSWQEQRRLRTGSEVGQRTDTIMLVHMQAGQQPTMVSLPRDSWVTIPAHTKADGTEVGAQQAKINAAFAFGGAPLLAETVEYNTGLHIDHYMEVGMGGIVTMTDAVGGVETCFKEAIQDEKSGLDVEAGCQVLDGAEALAWVRMRYSDPTGDLGRMQRQQQWVKLVVERLLGWQMLVNPFLQWEVSNAVLDAITVDEGTGVIDLGRFGLGMARIAGGSGEITTVPTNDSDHWENGQWVLKWDTAEADQLFASLGGSPPQASSTTP